MRSTLLDVCRTRWLYQMDGLERVQSTAVPILMTLDSISSNYDGSYSHEAQSDAQGVYWTMKSFPFIVHLVIVRNILAYLWPLSIELQAKRIDVVAVYEAVDTVTDCLSECRNEIHSKHAEWYNEAVELAATLGTSPTLKRITGQQTLRENYVTSGPEEYYKLALTIPFLDQILQELRSRFSQDH